MSEPFAHTSGPRDAKLVLLGEAHGESEEQHGVPFAGQSGRELFRMLGDAGFGGARELASIRGDSAWLAEREKWLHAQGILLTNVFALRPEKNNLGALCAAKGELGNGPASTLPPVRTENPRYVRAEYAVPELHRLATELASAPRNLVLCLGGTALWALTGSAAIGAMRGAVSEGRVLTCGEGRGGFRGERDRDAAGSTHLAAERGADAAGSPGSAGTSARDFLTFHSGLGVGSGSNAAARTDVLCGLRRADDQRETLASTEPRTSFKLLPTYHPAAVLRSWHWRPIVLADLLKCGRERAHPHVERPRRRVLVSPSIGEVEAWTGEALASARLLAPDIETLNGQIRCIGFACSREDVLVIPFVQSLKGGSYWGEEGDELRAWKCVRALLESPIPKVGQNFLFDLTYLSRVGIRPRNCLHDTMLLHHVLFPEMQKGLGFLGSVYTNESAWKLLRRHGEELKRDE